MRDLRFLALITSLCGTVVTPALAQKNAKPGTNTVLVANKIGFDGKVTPGVTPPSYETLINDALILAKPKNKTLFVYFGATWCGYCHLLHDVLHSKEIGPIISKYYVLVPVSTEEWPENASLNTPGATEAVDSLGLGSGLPKYALLDTAKKKLATEIGYPGNDSSFAEVLRKGSPQITEAELTTVRKYLKHLEDEQRKRNAELGKRLADSIRKHAAERKAQRERESQKSDSTGQIVPR